MASFLVMKKAIDESVNAAYHTESKFELTEAIDQAASYVSTRAYRMALKGWERKKVLMITGVPGVGKTSMARMLALMYLQQQALEGYIWVHSIQDIYAHWNDAPRAVFILDDFWGSIFHEDRTNQEENRLIKLLQRIASGKEDKRLILTTREYILQQGYRKHPELQEAVRQYAHVCSLDGYDADERAGILYQHLYTSGLDYAYVEYLYQQSKEIVFHPNYDPRAMALFLQNVQPDGHPETYKNDLLEHLDTPSAFWENVFIKLTPESQVAAMLLMISGAAMRYDELKKSYDRFVTVNPTLSIQKEIGECVAELEKTLIITHFDEDARQLVIRFRLPVVQDYLYNRLEKYAQQYLVQLMPACCYYNQLVFLYRHLAKDGSQPAVDELVDRLLEEWCETEDVCIDDYSEYDYFSPDEIGGTFECIRRLYILMDLYDKHENPKLKKGIEEIAARYCANMAQLRYDGLYSDLWNLPAGLLRMQKMGFKYPESKVIDAYYAEAFSIHHIDAMDCFEELYPAQYGEFMAHHREEIAARIDDLVLNEIEYLLDLEMEDKVEILLHSAEELYKKHGWTYTKEFEKQMFEWADWAQEEESGEEVWYSGETIYEREERTFEQTKSDSRWILGPSESPIEYEELIRRIGACDLAETIKLELLQGLEDGKIWLYESFGTEEGLEFCVAGLKRAGLEHLPDTEMAFLRLMLVEACGADAALAGRVMALLSYCCMHFLYNDKPVIRKSEFYEDEDVQELLSDAKIKHIFEQSFSVQDEQWICFVHIPLYLMVFVHRMYVIRMNDGQEDRLAYEHILGQDDPVLCIADCSEEQVVKTLCYPEYRTYVMQNPSWKACLCRLFEEMSCWEFNEEYVFPMLGKIAGLIAQGSVEEQVVSYLRHLDLQISYDAQGNPVSWIYDADEAFSLVEFLNITDVLGNAAKCVSGELLEQAKREGYVVEEPRRHTLRVKAAQMRDAAQIRQFVDFEEVYKSIEKIMAVYRRFSAGDFSKL